MGAAADEKEHQLRAVAITHFTVARLSSSATIFQYNFKDQGVSQCHCRHVAIRSTISGAIPNNRMPQIELTSARSN
jgi:hypothetical protein